MISARSIARSFAYATAIYLAWSWLAAAQVSVSTHAFDAPAVAERAGVLRAGTVLGLEYGSIVFLAKAITLTKLAIGLALFAGLAHAAVEWRRLGDSTDDVLDVALLVAALGAGVGVLAIAATGAGELAWAAAEFFLCIAVSEMLAFGRAVEQGPGVPDAMQHEA